MRKDDKNKLWIIMSISLLFFLAGCVDTGVQVIPSSINYTSQVKIVNLAAGMGSASIAMKTKSGSTVTFGAIAFGDVSPVTVVPAGPATLSVTYSSGGTENLTTLTDTDYNLFLYIVGDASGRIVVKSLNRMVFQAAYTSIYKKGVAQIAFFNGSPDGTINSIEAVQGSDTSAIDLSAPIASGTGSASFLEMQPGSYTFILTATSGDTETKTAMTVNLAEKNKYTAIVYDKVSSLKSKILTDD